MDEIQMQPQAKKKSCCVAPFWLGVCVGIAIFAVLFLLVMAANLIKFPGKTTTPKTPATNAQTPTSDIGQEIVGQAGTFTEVSEPVCTENGKPIIYMFSTSWCPHCAWARPLFADAVKSYVAQGKIVAHDWELDTYDDTLTSAKETSVPADANALYEKYNPAGSIPTFIFGCKYYRIGTGNEKTGDKAAETQEFKQLIDKLLLEK
ncbi:MAG: thioredoxin family protein [Candidatus Parcubacteria bacterium]|nr:thioredoxin family protein [Candidatus Parcubacteria bacterium]